MVVEGNREKDLSLLRMLDPDNLANPHDFYRRLREEDPVRWDPYLHAWVVTSYADVSSVLVQMSADRAPQPRDLERRGLFSFLPFAEMMRQQMMFMDGAKHAKLRAICAAAFNSRKVYELRADIEAIANELINQVIRDGRMEMIADFANPLPALVTAKLLGVPSEDHAQLHAWVLDLAEILGNYQHDPKRVGVIVESLRCLREYLSKRMAEQRIYPKEGLLHSLMTAEVDGQKLSDEEIIANTIITLIGGHETTTNLISSGFLSLLRNPGALQRLQGDPEILPSAVEELLRFESPVQHTARIARSDGILGDKEIHKGAKVVAVLAAANRDPARFPDPDRLDFDRHENRHLAFGWGAHLCFGAPLARIEAQVAFQTLMNRIKNPRFGTQTLRWRSNAGLRGLLALPILFDAHASV